METTRPRKATMLRLDAELMERVKSQAKREHRSVNNFIECLILNYIKEEADELTLAALKEAKSGKLRNVPSVDTSSVEAMYKSMGL